MGELKHPVVIPNHGDGTAVGDGPLMKVRGQREGVTLNPFGAKKWC